MLELNLPINNKESFNNFSMEEIGPIAKINSRGKVNNKDFTSKVGKILGIILPVEVGSISVKDEISIISMGPNEWLIILNDTIKESNNDYDLESVLFKAISKTNLGAITNVSDQFTIFSFKGTNICEILSKSSPFDFDTLPNNYSAQTLLNNTDVTIVKKNNESINLLVRRSFSEHLWDWIKDSANLN